MKRTVMIAGAVVVFVALLGSAAFVGVQLLNGQGLLGPASADGKVPLQLIPAQELPQTPADVRGVFDHRQDSSLFIGTGDAHIHAQRDRNGNMVQASSSYTGPLVEVVVSPQTAVYRDVTPQQFNNSPPAGQNIQQAVEPGSLDEVGQPSIITAWGKRTGDRLIADVLVYTPPPVLNARP